ncbi:MAG TPA: class I SAM-dependent methyltransferase [Roseiflexaceae bacterium]|nr:class I SAM-dependent methyltransferase [Roseiflexaceae bacterium]
MTLEQLRLIYRDQAPSYDRATWLVDSLLLNRLRREWLARAEGDVLEVAVGTGKNLEFYPPGCRVVGLDLAAEMLARAELRAGQLGRELPCTIGDAARLPYPGRRFDTVVSTLAACTFPDPVAAFVEMRRVLRPGGRILLIEHIRPRHPLFGTLIDAAAPYSIRAIGCTPNRDTPGNVRRAGLTITAQTENVDGMVICLEARPAA